MAKRVFVTKLTQPEQRPIMVRCVVEGNVLTDVRLGEVSILSGIPVSQRQKMLKDLSTVMGVEITVPHVSHPKMVALQEMAKQVDPDEGLGVKFEDCLHRYIGVPICDHDKPNKHLKPRQLRCMNCGATFVPCDKFPGQFHRMGEPCNKP